MFFVGLVVLTACGNEPEQVKMDRTYLSAVELEDQLSQLREAVKGEVLDEYVWVNGEEKVFTLLSKEYDAADQYSGIFLRHYVIGTRETPRLLWTYQDSISCKIPDIGPGSSGAVAGANLVKNTSPALRPAIFTDGLHQQFLLRYELSCSPSASRLEQPTLVVIDARTGTPEIRLEAGLTPEKTLNKLDRKTAARLFGLWKG